MTFSFRFSSLRCALTSLAALACATQFSPAALAANARSRPTRPVEMSDAEAYRSAIVIDAASGKVLVEDRADEIGPPASMTKLMTFAVLSDKLASGAITLQTPVDITLEDSRMGGTQVYLDPRETFPVEDLIFAMMIQSANDAAHALARASAGSVEAFVELMNAKAAELGMTQTKFRTPHGLPPATRRIADGDLTTAHDYALLCRHLLLKTDVLKYTSVRLRSFGEKVRPPEKVVQMKNHNNLLGKVGGVDGLKTGYTEGAGYCLSATAERNGRRVIAVVMGSFGPKGQKDLGRTRDLKTAALIERGFAALPPGTSNFDAERAKFVSPPLIGLQPAKPAIEPVRPRSAAGASSAPGAGAAEPATNASPVIKFSIPGK